MGLGVYALSDLVGAFLVAQSFGQPGLDERVEEALVLGLFLVEPLEEFDEFDAEGEAHQFDQNGDDLLVVLDDVQDVVALVLQHRKKLLAVLRRHVFEELLFALYIQGRVPFYSVRQA